MEHNPLLHAAHTYRHNAFAFDEFKLEHYLPAVEAGLEEARNNVRAIFSNPDAPTFDNTILALETASESLETVTTIYFNLMGAESNNEYKALAQQISPMLSEFNTEMNTNLDLFKRVEKVHAIRHEAGLNPEQIKLVENIYKSFVRSGVNLPEEQKAELMEINMELSRLSPQFGQNVLNATNAFTIHITDPAELDGLPQNAMSIAAHQAAQKGLDGWLITLQYPSMGPVLTYATNRALREKLSRASAVRAFGGEFDNTGLVKRIATLRHRRCNLLGYSNLSEFTLIERMAENPQTVMDFLDRIYDKAMPAARREITELGEFAKKLDGIDPLMGWDTAFYSEKLKKERFDVDDEALRPFFKLENVIEGVFTVANKLYGITFEAIDDIPTWHKDVKTFECHDANGAFLGLLYTDMHPRETKNGGAWMTTFRSQGLYNGEVIRPHVAMVCNFTPSTPDTPSLLSHYEVSTLFHEFGHALHALLSNCTYASLSSPHVYWDFVELPSQVMENWTLEKDALDLFARHYQTGESMPADLIAKVKAAGKFNAGINNIRQLSFGYLDMAWHNTDPSGIEDVGAYEDQIMEKTRLLPKLDNSNVSCCFSHIFAGGYASGYYSYKWAEVLDADAFEMFREKGIFDQETAGKFRDNVLAKGGTQHPMELYVAFRGRKPDPDALLRRDGLI
jgi:Zn-dependent oligopeptidase